jgi:hypothetical protein
VPPSTHDPQALTKLPIFLRQPQHPSAFAGQCRRHQVFGQNGALAEMEQFGVKDINVM